MGKLFQVGAFALHSGDQSTWKIDCDALRKSDWLSLGLYVRCFIVDGPFCKVIGVPTGGTKLAEILKPFECGNPAFPTLIVDDVLTSGGSMEEARRQVEGPVKGVVVFARGECPDWVEPIFSVHPSMRK